MQEESFRFPRYELKDKVAVVTGSGQGLGKWIALGLAEAGADILVLSLYSGILLLCNDSQPGCGISCPSS